MTGIHLSRELLLAVSQGELHPDLLVRLGLEHLLGLCSHCREEFEAFQRLQAGRGNQGTALKALSVLLDKEQGGRDRQSRQAVRDFEDLLSLDAKERADRVRRSRKRFRGPELARLLLEESRTRTTTQPTEAFDLADLARAVLLQSPPDYGLLALASAYMANACRAGGELRRAEEYFAHVRYLILHQGVTDPAVLARIDDLEGSLRKDQRHFDEAESLLVRAAMLYGVVRAQPDISRVLINLGALHNLRGRPNQAIETTRLALSRLPPDAEPRLYLSGRYNLAFYLAGAGKWEEAADLLEIDEDLYRQFPEPWVQLRHTWVRARIAAGAGDLPEAERLYSTVRQGFLRQGIGYDAAIVSLELALLYLREGRTSELKTQAREMLPIFRAQDVHREAVAALVLFQEAVRREELTLTFLEDLAAYLDFARNDPSLRFGDGKPVS